jgi:hypothetical protein
MNWPDSFHFATLRNGPPFGTSVVDSSAGLFHAQIPEGTVHSTAVPPLNPATPPAPQAIFVAPPILQVTDSDPLSVRRKCIYREAFAEEFLL